MSQIARDPSAFSVTRQRRPRVKKPEHLVFIKTLRCVICGALHPDPAHLRAASAKHGKRYTGGAEKPDDRWVTPLCRKHHDEQHSMGELEFWGSYGIDPFALALSLHGVSGDEETAMQIIRANAPRTK